MDPNNHIDALPAPRPKRLEGAFRANAVSLSGSLSSLTWEQAIRVIRKQRWLLIGAICGLTALSAATAFFMRDVYQPVARLEIDPASGGIRTLQEIENPTSVEAEDLDYLDTQIQILQSDGLAMRVIRALRLDRNPEFITKKELGESDFARASETTRKQPENEGALLQEQLNLADPTRVEAAALRSFHKKLSVNPIRGTRLVEVGFASHDPSLAQRVTNSLVAQFIDQNYRNRYITTMGASEWLSNQINDLRQKVSESNQAAADYQKKYGLVESDDRNIPLGELMADVSKQLSDAQADRIQSEAYVRMIDLGQPEGIPALRDDLVYQNLLTRYADVRAQLAQALTIYGDENSNVKKLQNEANELVAQVEAERARIVSRLRTAFSAAQAREQMMIDARDRLRTKMGDESSHMVEYQTLRAEALASAQLYNTLQTRLREAGIYAGLRSGNIRLVDMAPHLFKPTSPHRTLIIGIAAVLSCVLGLTLAFVRDSFDNTVRIPDDIRDWLHLPSLAVLPRVKEGRERKSVALPSTSIPWNMGLAAPRVAGFPKLFWDQRQTAEAEAIRALRTSLLVSSGLQSPRVVLVSSPSAGEGKTTVAINLASVLALQGKTCLIEGDLRRPMIEFAMGLSAPVGLVEVLNGTAALGNAIVPLTAIPGLSVLPIKSIPANPSDLLASGQMATLIRSVREMFDYVVIDSPPVIPFSDARSLALACDALILVCRYGSTTRRSLALSADIFSEMQVPLMGVVLNDMDLSSPDFHYFNYGYSWRKAEYTSNYAKPPLTPPPPSSGGDTPPAKSKGAHA